VTPRASAALLARGAAEPTADGPGAGLAADAVTTAGRPPRGTLRRALRLLDVHRGRFVGAALLGTGALGSAVALAAVSAWLIARASQMPPVLTLSVATVAVRAFGIGRGVLRYCERLVSHDVALRGMASLRTTLYARLAEGRPEAGVRLRRGDLLARVGADVDAVGDAVVRGLLPAVVAGLLGVGTVTAMTLFWPPAGAALGGCLLLAGVLAPVLSLRALRVAETRAVEGRAASTAAALAALDSAGPLAVAGRLDDVVRELRDADVAVARAADVSARPAALGAGVGQLAVGLAVLAALVTGIPGVVQGMLAPVELAVVVLTPLAAFEATALLPAAAAQLARSRAAAARVLAVLDDAGEPAAASPATLGAPDRPRLVAQGLTVARPGGAPLLRGLELAVEPGRLVALVGPSGCGKTTALLTLAGLLHPAGGSVTLDGADVAGLPNEQRAGRVVLAAEDAHVFGTTVLENLRVARGDLTAGEADALLREVGLGPWLDALPDGLDTLLGPDGRTVSGGERRRLLVARALASPAPLVLLDEPVEHLDAATADDLVRRLAARSDRGFVVVTHRTAALEHADLVIRVHADGSIAQGTHARLLAEDDEHRADLEAQQATAGSAVGPTVDTAVGATGDTTGEGSGDGSPDDTDPDVR